MVIQAPGSFCLGLSPSSGSSEFVLVSLFLNFFFKHLFLYLSVLASVAALRIFLASRGLPRCIWKPRWLWRTGLVAPQHLGS